MATSTEQLSRLEQIARRLERVSDTHVFKSDSERSQLRRDAEYLRALDARMGMPPADGLPGEGDWNEQDEAYLRELSKAGEPHWWGEVAHRALQEIARLRRDSKRLDFLVHEGFVPLLRRVGTTWELEVDYGNGVVTASDPGAAIDAAILYEHSSEEARG